MIGVEAGLRLPCVCRFVVARNIPFIVFKTGGVNFIFWQAPHFGEQLPRPSDGFLFVVIAERPVAEHFKKRVMRVVTPHIFEVVVLACHAHTLLRVDGAGVGFFVGTDKDVLKLNHARIGEEKRRISAGNERHRRHGGMSVFDEEVNESLADFVTGKFTRH